MFFKWKKPNAVIAPEAMAPKRGYRDGASLSIISADLIIHGTLISAGDIQMDGKVDGEVRANAIVIGDKAFLVGDVYAEEAVVRGHVEGSIRVRKLQLCATCHVEGNIFHEALSVEIGAFFEGNCRHSDNPLCDAPKGGDRQGGISKQRLAATHPGPERRSPFTAPPPAVKTATHSGAAPLPLHPPQVFRR